MRRLIRTLAWTSAAALLAGCTSDISLEDFNFARRTSNFVNSQTLAFSSPARDFSVRPVRQDDLIGPQGQCAAPAGNQPTPVAAGPEGTEEQATAVLVQGGIALQMTECEVVARAGAPDNIEFGDGGQRSVVLTYMRGPRPGIYRFAGGRLYSIERGPEPPAPPPKKAAPAKKKRQPA